MSLVKLLTGKESQNRTPITLIFPKFEENIPKAWVLSYSNLH